MSVPNFIADFDSAAGMALAGAYYLRGDEFDALGQPRVLKPFARSVGRLPDKAREKIFIASGALETVSPRRVHRLKFDKVGRWLGEMYPAGPYPAVAIGSSNGALTHLYAALGIPWLPQTLLVPVRQRVHPDDPVEAMEHARKYGRRMMDALPDMQLHHMHDASQDRLMVRALTYFRVKRRALGADFERFLLDRLQPGGTIIVADCQLSWRTTSVGERYVFQHGAPNGVTEDEYHHGSQRIAEYLERYDSPVRKWREPEPDGVSPEAEWGFEPALLDDIEQFANRHGFRVLRLAFGEPTDVSPLIADFFGWWNRHRRRIPANRLIVSSFILTEPHWTMRTGAVPDWMKFNSEPSLQKLESYLDDVEDFDAIYLLLFQHGVQTPGLPTAKDWRRLLDRARRSGLPVGLDLDEYPLDFPHFAKYSDEIARLIPSRYPVPAPVPIAVFEQFLAEHRDRYDVGLHEVAPRSVSGAW